jgi:ankyrin repeat protein
MCDRWRKYEDLLNAGEEDKLMKMVRRKEDINSESGPLKKTLVHLVAEHGQVDLLAQLVDREANLSVVSMIGDTPAHLAARNGHARMVEFLGDNENDPQDLNRQVANYLLAVWLLQSL